MLILGIDPGFAIVGFGLVEADRGRQRLVQCGAITTPAGEPLPARLRQIADDMDLLLAQFQPQAMAPSAEFERRAQAGRRRRRGGHRPVPCPFVYLPPSEPRRGPPGQRAL